MSSAVVKWLLKERRCLSVAILHTPLPDPPTPIRSGKEGVSRQGEEWGGVDPVAKAHAKFYPLLFKAPHPSLLFGLVPANELVQVKETHW